MTVLAVIYRFSDDVATRDGARPEHRDYLRGLADEGLLLMSGPFTADGGDGALLLFRGDDRARVAALVENDPFTSAGVIAEVEVVEWEPVIGPLRSAL
jgi:uncharacterized protein